MFSENQTKALSYNLDDSRIKTIDKAGMSFKYLETYDIINVANTIFNYMWNYTITRLEEVARAPIIPYQIRQQAKLLYN